eukprot:4047701-Amphidinium_carterae.1
MAFRWVLEFEGTLGRAAGGDKDYYRQSCLPIVLYQIKPWSCAGLMYWASAHGRSTDVHTAANLQQRPMPSPPKSLKSEDLKQRHEESVTASNDEVAFSCRAFTKKQNEHIKITDEQNQFATQEPSVVEWD